jgi:hypothetical protein
MGLSAGRISLPMVNAPAGTKTIGAPSFDGGGVGSIGCDEQAVTVNANTMSQSDLCCDIHDLQNVT